jgi:hypothetical protein
MIASNLAWSANGGSRLNIRGQKCALLVIVQPVSQQFGSSAVRFGNLIQCRETQKQL